MALTAQSDSLSSVQPKGSNPLDDFQSFNNLFTLAGCTRVQTTGNIKKSDINNIICRSQSIGPDGGVETPFGKFDYFIDDVTIVTIPKLDEKTGNGFATKLTFKVFEPYSMGLFMLALKSASTKSGYNLNYNEAPYVFMIEWIGWKENQPGKPDDKLTRILPIRITDVKFRVGTTGSTYEVTAIPYNEIAFRENVVKNVSDIQISGQTVEEMLVKGTTSLLSQITTRYNEEINSGRIQDVDEIRIEFPKDFTQPPDRIINLPSTNEISESKIYEDFNNAGSQPFSDLTDIFVEGKQIFSTKPFKLVNERTWLFPQEIPITDIITEIVIRSHYITDQIQGKELKTDNNGMVKWFRTETRVEDDSKDIAQLGRQKRIIIYRIVPYLVHSFRFLPPGKKPQKGFGNLKDAVSRVYDYIYTGKNTEILNLELTFDMAFFTPVQADVAMNVGQSNPGQKGITAGGQETKQTVNSGVESVPLPAMMTGGIQGSYERLTALSQQLSQTANPADAGGSAELVVAQVPTGQAQFQFNARGGGATDNPNASKVRTMQRLLTNPGDMVNLNMEIMGDPYYIPTSGMGSQIVKPTSSFELDDGSMNYQSNEVMIVINFRTPIDFDPRTGLYKFDQKIDMWSGLYLIWQVESKFNQNKFTQNIKGIRLRQQIGDQTADNIFIVEDQGQNQGQGNGMGLGQPTNPGTPFTGAGIPGLNTQQLEGGPFRQFPTQ